MDSKLSMVTVYNNRAQLFYSAQLEVAPEVPGEDVTLVFSRGQWSEANRSTLQVNIKEGGSAIVLRSVQFRTVTSVEDVRPQKQALREEIEALTKEQRALKDQMSVNVRTTEAYKSVLVKVHATTRSSDDVKYNETVSSFVLDPTAQERMCTFVVSAVRDLTTKYRDIEVRAGEVDRRLSAARAKLTACGGDEKRTTTDVAEVQIVLNAPTKLQLLLSYITSNASWTPSYDLRVDSKQKMMAVHYNAVVRQSTLTDWDKVQLELSTASPHVGGDPPKLSKWNISLRPPPGFLGRSAGAASQPMMMMQQMMVTNMMPAAPPPPPPGGPAPSPARPALAESASITTSTTSTTFCIVGRQTIKSDNNDVKVTITQSQLPVHLRYSAVPKLDQHTYLKAKAINTTGCILLPGTVNTFADNQFIGKSSMDSTAPDEEFWTFLGVDDDVSCTRKLAHRKLADKSGFLGGKKTRVEYKYVFTAKNGKRTSEEVVVWDQFPVAEDKKISVSVTCPTKDSSPPVRYEVNNLNAIEWFWDLKPNSSQTFEFCFHVDYPTDERITGLS